MANCYEKLPKKGFFVKEGLTCLVRNQAGKTKNTLIGQGRRTEQKRELGHSAKPIFALPFLISCLK